MRRLEATIDELSPGGEGVAIAEIDGERRAIFVPGVARGERVRVEAELSRRPARGRLLQVLEASPSRVAPACRHVETCGGCDWMHLSDEAQREAHVAIVASVLPPPFAEVHIEAHAAPRALAYRTRARVHVETRGKKVIMGMHGRRSRDPVEVAACVVLHPAIEQARLALAALLAGTRGRGEVQLSLGAPATPRLAVLEVVWSGDLPGEVFARVEQAVKGGALAGARVFAGAVKTPARIGDPTPWVLGPDGAPLRLAPGGFAQAGEEGNALLAQRVATLAREVAPSRSPAIELFSGAGNLTVMLARDFDVTAIESDAEACEAARQNLSARGLVARVTTRDAGEHVRAQRAPGTKLVVLDPPRTGARDVARALADKPLPAVVYVSCDPPTLGRDLETLARAYDIHALETFEMFPQTSHVETVVALVKKRPS
jgi:23S rRNA (uracil1939-C5)-methyltransferase